ncbi:hypothetical protein QFC20_003847, partial [Naganishia adeliensis]
GHRRQRSLRKQRRSGPSAEVLQNGPAEQVQGLNTAGVSAPVLQSYNISAATARSMMHDGTSPTSVRRHVNQQNIQASGQSPLMDSALENPPASAPSTGLKVAEALAGETFVTPTEEFYG